MAESHVTLTAMTADEYAAYLPRRVLEYAAEGAEATGMLLEEARAFAKRQVEGLLPEGRHTAGQHFRTIRDEAGEAIGTLWFSEERSADPPHLFLYDVVVDAACRGRGLGAAAMRGLEEEARRRGLAAVRLHVFKTNRGAIRLYERLGYRVTHAGDGGQQMTKEVSPA